MVRYRFPVKIQAGWFKALPLSVLGIVPSVIIQDDSIAYPCDRMRRGGKHAEQWLELHLLLDWQLFRNQFIPAEDYIEIWHGMRNAHQRRALRCVQGCK